MITSLDEILYHLQNLQVLKLHNMELQVPYMGVKPLSRNMTGFDERFIYVGRASDLVDVSSLVCGGFMLINDNRLDLSGCPVSVAEFSPATDLPDLLEQVRGVFFSVSEVKSAPMFLLNALVRGKGLKNMLDLSARTIGNPILLVTADLSLLSLSSPTALEEPDIAGILDHIYGSPEFGAALAKQNLQEEASGGPLPLLLDCGLPATPHVIVGAITIRRRMAGFMIVLEADQPFDRRDASIVGVICDILSAELQQGELYKDLRNVTNEYHILSLLNGKTTPPEIMDPWIKSLNWDGRRGFYVVCMTPGNDRYPIMIEILRNRIERTLPFCKTVYFEESLVVVASPASPAELASLKQSIGKLLANFGVEGGISRRFVSVMDLRKHYQQARAAQEIGKRLHSESALHEYDLLDVYALLSCAASGMDIGDLCLPALDLLIEYDARRGTEYYLTLHEYLKAGSNQHLAARRLVVHRNTMAYRMAKIAEITGLDLDDGEARFRLFLSFKIKGLTTQKLF
jgi:hypothetical protein